MIVSLQIDAENPGPKRLPTNLPLSVSDLESTIMRALPKLSRRKAQALVEKFKSKFEKLISLWMSLHAV